MSDETDHNIVEQFQPNARDVKVLEYLIDVHGTGDGTARAGEIRDALGLPSTISWNFDRLCTAGWIERTDNGRYRFVADPRDTRAGGGRL